MTYESIQPIIDWIRDNPTWSGFIVFLISLSESLAIVGLVVPGVVMMTAIGAMMGSGILPFWLTLIWAILGAIAGDGISYWLGYHYHQHLRDFWPFRQFPHLLSRGEAFFKNHGGKSIIFGRFVGPVRPMIPVIAGMMDMKPKRFLFFNIVSAIAWAPLYSLPGILIGVSLGALSPEVAKRVALFILLLLLILWIIYAFVIKIALWIKDLIVRGIRKLWKSFEASHRLTLVHKALAARMGSEEGQLGLLILFTLSLVSFVYITWSVMHTDEILSWNEAVYQVMRSLYVSKLVDGTALFTGLGAPSVILPVAFLLGVWFFFQKRYLEMFCWLGTFGISEAIAYGLKYIVAMPRPEGLLHVSTEFAYPSGHALTAVLFYGLLAGFIHHSVEKEHRWIPWAITIPLVLLISISRVYIGMHWFTDVLGGLAWGIASVALAMFFYQRYASRPLPLKILLMPGLILLAISYTFYGFRSFPKHRQDLTRHWTVEEISRENWWQNEGNINPLHRSGAVKRVATLFDIEWLGQSKDLQNILSQQGFILAPSHNFQNWLTILVKEPKPEQVPELPRFHRDRLPVLVMIKPLSNNERFVIEIWQSDIVDEKGKSLWVGTFRHEVAIHPLPLVTLFVESSDLEQPRAAFLKMLQNHPGIQYKSITTMEPEHQIILIQSR